MQRYVKLKKIKRKRKHGFLARRESHAGKKLIERRRKKGRTRLSV